MLHALNLGESGRILSATYDGYAPEEQPRAEELPEGNISNYRYVDGEYIYDPLPEPEPPEPAPEYVTYDELAAAIKEGVDSYGE